MKIKFKNEIKQSQKNYMNSTTQNPFLRNIFIYPQPPILKNKYSKLKKTFTKFNNFLSYPTALRQKNIYDCINNKPNQNQDIIRHLIKSEKQRLTYKLETPSINNAAEILFYIKSSNSEIRNPTETLTNASSNISQSKYKRAIKQKRQYVQSIKKIEKSEANISSPKVQNLNGKLKKTFTINNNNKISTHTNSLRKKQISKKKISEISYPSFQKQIIEEKLLQTKKYRSLLNYDFKQFSNIKSQSFAIIEYPSNQMIVSYRSRITLEIASLTKIMTCYLIIKLCSQNNIDIQTEKIQVGEFVQEITGTTAELIHGDIYTIQQLLYGLMLPSGNDAAVCLADWGGQLLTNRTDFDENQKRFVQQMNRRCRQLNLSDTRYGNPHGLPSMESKSCSLDVCKLISICMKLPLFKKIIITQKFRFYIKTSDNNQRQIIWQNTNKLLRREGFVGVKTGITVTAGPCLATAYKFKEKMYIIVVLRSNKVSRRFSDTRKILYWALNRLYKGNLSRDQVKILQQLNKKNIELDSDNSEDEAQFTYNNEDNTQYARRHKILKYEL